MHTESSAHSFVSDDANQAVWHQQLNLLLDSTGEGIFGIDLEGRCVFINRAGAKLLGREASAYLGQNMHEVTHHSHADGSHYPDTQCPIFNAFRQGLPCRIESEVFWRHDHTSFAVEYSSYPIMDGGQVRGAVITFLDITHRRQAADALQRANDELEWRVGERTRELSVALGQLRKLGAYSEKIREEERTRIAREVHDELGSLLVVLKMDVNWMDKRLSEQAQRSSPEAQSMRERLRHKCQSMSQLIETAVVNVGRIITDLRPSILDHQGLWAALEWQAHEFAQSAEIVLDWRMEGTGDVEVPEHLAMAVFRIFQEMLSNVARHAKATHVSVQITVSATELSLLVRDNGCGALVDAFDAPTSYGVLGMRERARHHGGAWPSAARWARGLCSTCASRCLGDPMIRLLLGDDHRIVREGLKQVLADATDVTVVAEAQSGTDVLDQVRRLGGCAGLDLVLLDIAMPEGDGLEVLQVLRREHPALPVLMLSTYPEKQYAVRCIKLGAGGYLCKSADPDEMVAAVRKVAKGGLYVTPTTAEALAAAIGAGATSANAGAGLLEKLSHREHQVFRLLTAGHSVREIGAQLKLAPNTVSTYRARILEKTGVKNDVELALFAERHK